MIVNCWVQAYTGLIDSQGCAYSMEELIFNNDRTCDPSEKIQWTCAIEFYTSTLDYYHCITMQGLDS